MILVINTGSLSDTHDDIDSEVIQNTDGAGILILRRLRRTVTALTVSKAVKAHQVIDDEELTLNRQAEGVVRSCKRPVNVGPDLTPKLFFDSVCVPSALTP